MDRPNQSAATAQGKRGCFKLAFSAAITAGALIPFFPEYYLPLSIFFFLVPANIAFAVWIQYDFIEHDYQASRLFFLSLIAVSTFVLTWYLFRTRGPRAFISLTKMLLVYALLVAAFIGAAMATDGTLFAISPESQQSPLLK